MKFRFYCSIIVIIIFFIATTVFTKINTDDFQDNFFILTMATVVIQNIFSAFLSGSLYAMVAMFPSEYISSFMSGRALGGILCTIVSILSIAFATKLPATSTFIYFIAGTVMLVLAHISFMVIQNTEFYQYHQKLQFRVHEMKPNFMKVLNKIKMHAFSSVLTCVTTYSVFPAILVLIYSLDRDNGSLWNVVYFTPVCTYLIFNTGNYVGRILSGWIKRPKYQPNLIALISLIRLGFIPAFLFCNITQKHSFPVIFKSDSIFIVFMIVFSISQGYIVNISMMTTPAWVAYLLIFYYCLKFKEAHHFKSLFILAELSRNMKNRWQRQ